MMLEFFKLKSLYLSVQDQVELVKTQIEDGYKHVEISSDLVVGRVKQLIVLRYPSTFGWVLVVDCYDWSGLILIIFLDNNGYLFLLDIIDEDSLWRLPIDNHAGQLNLPLIEFLLKIAIFNILHHQLQIPMQIFNLQFHYLFLLLCH